MTLDTKEIIGHFGPYGGRFVPEALIGALEELEAAHIAAAADPTFAAELEHLHRTYTGRPSIITEVPRFAAHAGGARIILKREDLNHTGSHKINNVLGQALLTKRMGKSASLQKLELANTELLQLLLPRLWVSIVLSTWVKKIQDVNHLTSHE